MKNFDVIVIGAGPAGLVAAARSAEKGARVLVLEKMSQAGRKLLITGKGRCNITNDKSIGEFVKFVHPGGRFLRTAFSNFYSADILNLLNKYGVETVLERGGRYFPASNSAADVLKALLAWNEENNTEIRRNSRVEKLLVEEGRVSGVAVNGEIIKSRAVILATGGKSYPATGSTGEGFELARQVGHHVEPLRPALVPLETIGNVAQKLQGLTLKNINAIVWVKGKKKAEEFGELLFTHFGLSGPVILTLSRMVVDELRNKNEVEISIDLKPALDEQKLDNRLMRDLDENGRKKLINVARYWLPSNMVPVFIDQLGLDPEKECNQVSSKERKAIRYLLKNMKFKVLRPRSFKEAIITAGGISQREISSKTMESKLIPGLYFAGEIIDVDGDTGGYNLQIAYSTGWLAGDSAAGVIQS
jgi:hypothetical protein